MSCENCSNYQSLNPPARQERLYPLETRVATIPGVMTAAFAPWGQLVGNNYLLNLVGENGDRDDYKQMLKNLLITGRWHSLPPLERDLTFPFRESLPQEEKDRQVMIGAEITNQALEAFERETSEKPGVSKSGQKILFVTTSSLPPCKDFVGEIANKTNLEEIAGPDGVVEKKEYFLACNVGAPLLDGLYGNYDLIVVTAVEALSNAVNWQELYRGVNLKENLPVAAVFGNLTSCIVVAPKKISVLAGKTAFETKRQGIEVPPTYDLPPVNERQGYPAWYEFRGNDGEVAMAKERVAFNEEGLRVVLPESDTGYIKMDGNLVLRIFAKLATDVFCDVWEESKPKIEKMPEYLWISSHQPSGGAFVLVRKGIVKGVAGDGLPLIKMLWSLRRKEVGNGSSSTLAVNLVDAIEKRLLHEGMLFAFLIYGIGNSCTAIVAEV